MRWNALPIAYAFAMTVVTPAMAAPGETHASTQQAFDAASQALRSQQ